jgi:hypothetical protein
LDEFLNRLTGSWSLIGVMGDKKLFQEAVGRWVLNGLFVELRFRAIRVGEGGNPPYEAIYLIGFDANWKTMYCTSLTRSGSHQSQ